MTKEDEQRLFNTVVTLHDVVNDVHKKFESHIENQSKPWGTLGTWAAVILTAVAGMSTLVTSPMWDQINDNKRMNIEQEKVLTDTRIQIAKIESIKTQE